VYAFLFDTCKVGTFWFLDSFGINEFQIILWLVLWWKPVRVMVILSKMFFAGNPCFISPFPSIYPYIPLTAENHGHMHLGIHEVRLIFILCSTIILRTHGNFYW